MWVFVGVSERGAPPASTNQVILYVAAAYTYVHIHTPRLPPTLPFSRASRPEYTCPPFLSTRHRPRRTGSRRNECAATHDRSRISFDATGSFTSFRSFARQQGNYSIFDENRARYFSPRNVPSVPGLSFDESIPSHVSCVCLRHHDNDRQLPSPPPPFMSAKLSGLIARKIRPDFET